VAGSDAFDPTPVYGRGCYFDGTAGNLLTLGNINVGTDSSWAFWYKATDFKNLFEILNGSSASVFWISGTGSTIQLGFVGWNSETPYTFDSTYVGGTWGSSYFALTG
jgi:hypothetical protein